MRKPDKEIFKYIIYDTDTGGVVFNKNTPAYFNTVDDINPILSRLNKNDVYNRYIARLANLADIKKSMKNGPGTYFITTLYARLANNEFNKEIKMYEKTFKYVIIDNSDGSVLFLDNEKPYFDTKEEIVNALSKININKGPKAYSIGVASLESLNPFLKNGSGRYNIPTVSPDIISDHMDIFRNQEALSQQQAMERQHAMNNPFNPDHYFRPEFAPNNFNGYLFPPTPFQLSQMPQSPQFPNRFSLPNMIPIINNKATVFNNYPDWKLIKKIGTDESGTKVVVEVEIDGTRIIKIVDANEITSKNIGVFFVVVITLADGDAITINPSLTVLQTLVFKTAYRFDYYDDGVFVISEEIKDVNELITEMNKELNETIMANMQANQGSTLIR